MDHLVLLLLVPGANTLLGNPEDMGGGMDALPLPTHHSSLPNGVQGQQ